MLVFTTLFIIFILKLIFLNLQFSIKILNPSFYMIFSSEIEIITYLIIFIIIYAITFVQTF